MENKNVFNCQHRKIGGRIKTWLIFIMIIIVKLKMEDYALAPHIFLFILAAHILST